MCARKKVLLVHHLILYKATSKTVNKEGVEWSVWISVKTGNELDSLQ